VTGEPVTAIVDRLRAGNIHGSTYVFKDAVSPLRLQQPIAVADVWLDFFLSSSDLSFGVSRSSNAEGVGFDAQRPVHLPMLVSVCEAGVLARFFL